MTRVLTPQRSVGTFEFVKLRLGDYCVPAVEIHLGEDSLVDELPENMDRRQLRAWLAAHGLTEIYSH